MCVRVRVFIVQNYARIWIIELELYLFLRETPPPPTLVENERRFRSLEMFLWLPILV